MPNATVNRARLGAVLIPPGQSKAPDKMTAVENVEDRSMANNRGLPRWVFWGTHNYWWGEVVWSWLHKAPLRYGTLPERLRQPLNIWRVK